MQLRRTGLGLIGLFIVGTTTGCCGAIGCIAPAVSFQAASESAKVWVENCLDGNWDTASKYWSPAAAQVGENECNLLPKVRASILETSTIQGIDYHVYYVAKVVSLEESDAVPCLKGIRVFLERSDGKKSMPLTFFVANADSSPNKVALYAVKYDRTCPAPTDDSQPKGFESCFWNKDNTAKSFPPDVHIFKINTQSPLSFEMLMARNSDNVNEGKSTKSSPRERVTEMVSRTLSAGQHPVLAFNADYFSDPANPGDHGPEGLTVRNGKRLDGKYAAPEDTDGGLDANGNTNETRRSSLSFAKSLKVRIGIQTACTKNCFSYRFEEDDYYNTTGGGPLFMDNGRRVVSTDRNDPRPYNKPCTNEGLGTNYCAPGNRTAWTAVGVTQDGRYLIVAVGEQQTMDTIAPILKSEGAWRAMKLDGGASTQLWYNGRNILVGGRPIANAILVYSQQ